jgi:uncharacterized protein (TIGR02594 family)
MEPLNRSKGLTSPRGGRRYLFLILSGAANREGQNEDNMQGFLERTDCLQGGLSFFVLCKQKIDIPFALRKQRRRAVKKIETSAYEIAQRFVGIEEVSGRTANPQILVMLKLDMQWPEDDSVPWCSGFVNYVAWLLRLPRSKSLRARSWLTIGEVLSLEDAEAGFDVVIFKRGSGDQPGPDVIDAPGHVGFFAGVDGENILVLGGNQSDSVTIGSYSKSRLLGVRRIG